MMVLSIYRMVQFLPSDHRSVSMSGSPAGLAFFAFAATTTTIKGVKKDVINLVRMLLFTMGWDRSSEYSFYVAS